MNESDGKARPLAVLRAMIDAIDRDVLQLLSRRMAIVGEIAAYKREHATRIRDLERERSVIEDRCRRAEKLGLPQADIEAMYRLILLGSRDHQAALRAEVPADAKSYTVAIIGGKGGMGSCLARLFADLGHAVLIADLDTELTPAEAALVADVVVVSVPIRDTEQVIRQIGPQVRPDGLLMDVTSLKSAPMAAMLESTEAAVLGTHPMFGPGMHSFQGQRIVLCRGRGDEWYRWARGMFEARGLTVTEATPAEHDRAMSIVQVLNHYQTQVFGLSLSRLGDRLEDTLRFLSPAYLMELYVAARHFAQDPHLYGPIQMLNPRLTEVLAVFSESAAELARAASAGDQQQFDELFAEVRRFFGPFLREAKERSSFMIDRLVERS